MFDAPGTGWLELDSLKSVLDEQCERNQQQRSFHPDAERVGVYPFTQMRAAESRGDSD